MDVCSVLSCCIFRINAYTKQLLAVIGGLLEVRPHLAELPGAASLGHAGRRGGGGSPVREQVGGARQPRSAPLPQVDRPGLAVPRIPDAVRQHHLTLRAPAKMAVGGCSIIS